MEKNKKEYKKLYYEKNKEKIKQKVLEWREKNKEKWEKYNIEYTRQYNKDNKEKVTELNKEYYKKNKEIIRQKQKEYYKNKKTTKQLYIIDNKWIIDFIPTIIEAVYMCSNLTHLSLEHFKVVYVWELSHPNFNENKLCNVEPNEDSDLAKTHYVIYEIDKEDKIWDCHYTIKITKLPPLLNKTIKKSLNK